MNARLHFLRAFAQMIVDRLEEYAIKAKWGGGTTLNHAVNCDIILQSTMPIVHKDWISRMHKTGKRSYKLWHDWENNIYMEGKSSVGYGQWPPKMVGENPQKELPKIHVNNIEENSTFVPFIAASILIATSDQELWDFYLVNPEQVLKDRKKQVEAWLSEKI